MTSHLTLEACAAAVEAASALLILCLIAWSLWETRK